LHHAFQSGSRRPRPKISGTEIAGLAKVERRLTRFERDVSIEETNECTLPNLIVFLKWLYHEAIREEEDAPAAPFSSHNGGDVARTLAINDGPE
jgi:hypothetical protein